MARLNQRQGRVGQKERTRAAIVEAARRLHRPSVEHAADAAGVSRATAYRYFPTQESLTVELDADGIWNEIEAQLAQVPNQEVGAAIEHLIDAIVTVVYANERHVRTALRVYHDTWLRDPGAPVRKGRRMEWINRVIEPLTESQRAQLRVPLALTIGPDQVTMLKDVAGLNEVEAKRVLRWSARALLGAVLGVSKT